MKPEIKSQWVDALRSGKFVQGRRGLRRDIGGEVTHCALGVLCELAVEAGATDRRGARSFGKHRQYPYSLPPEVVRWSGITDDYGSIARSCVTITGLNDSGKSFVEIADVIEERL